MPGIDHYALGHIKEAAVYAYGYYKNWLEYGGFDYTEYEKKMLELFIA